MDTARYLVTGATGFIGTHLVRRLLADRHEVHVLVRAGSASLPGVAPQVRAHKTDGTAHSVAQAVRAAQPDCVVHLAALFRAEHGPDDVDAMIDANVRLTVQVLDAMEAAGARNFVCASTSWQHHAGAPYDPVNLYAATKQASEDILKFYCSARGLSAVALVLADTYGPRDPRPKLFAALARATQSEEPVAFSPGEQRLDLVHVDDVVEAFAVACARATNNAPGTLERFAVGADAPILLRELASLYAQVRGCSLNIDWGGRPYRDREVMTATFGAPPLPGWSPRVALAEGLATLAPESGR